MNAQPVIQDIDTKSALELTLKVFRAWETLQADNLTQYFRRAPQDIFFHYYSKAYHHWEDYKKEAQRFLDEHKLLALQIEDARVFREGDVIYCAVTHRVDEELKNGKRASREARYTVVLLPSTGSPKIVHEHWSLPVRAAGWENY